MCVCVCDFVWFFCHHRCITDPLFTVRGQRFPNRPCCSLSVFPLARSSSSSSLSFHSSPPTTFLMSCLPPTHNRFPLSAVFALPNNILSSLSPSSFFSSAYLLPRGNLLFLAWSVYLSCPHLPLADPLETVVVLCV